MRSKHLEDNVSPPSFDKYLGDCEICELVSTSNAIFLDKKEILLDENRKY